MTFNSVSKGATKIENIQHTIRFIFSSLYTNKNEPQPQNEIDSVRVRQKTVSSRARKAYNTYQYDNSKLPYPKLSTLIFAPHELVLCEQPISADSENIFEQLSRVTGAASVGLSYHFS